MKDINFYKKILSKNTVFGNTEEIEECLKLIFDKYKDIFFVKKYKFKDRPMMVLSNSKKKDLDLILAGHIDVVPAGKSQFKPVIKNNKLFARGTYDMKIALLASVDVLKSHINDENLKFAIFITSDEEVDGLSTKYLLNNIGYKAKFAIIPDGGDDKKLVIAQKGFIQLKMVLKGKSTHASKPFNGKNPLQMISDLQLKLSQVFPNPMTEDDWKTSVVPTYINSGSAYNQIPDKAEIVFDIRYVRKSDVKKIMSISKKMFNKNIDIEIVAENGNLDTPKSNSNVKKLLKAMEKGFGNKVLLSKTSGTSDAIFFMEKKIPAVLFKPNGGGAHQNDEWIDLKSLEKFKKVLEYFIDA